MIIVEGPDGAGKTTLLNQLRTYTGFPIAPRVVSKDAEAMVNLTKWVEANLTEGFVPMLFDRHRLISEPIYGPILRPRMEKGFTDPSWFYTQLSRFYELEPIIIYCLPPLRRVWENVQHDPDNKVVADQQKLQAIWGAYFNKAMSDAVNYPNTVIYDYTDKPLAKLQLMTITRLIDSQTG